MAPIAVIDEKLLSIQSDAEQIRSINEFTDSLVSELQDAKTSKPSKALLRELLSPCANRALDIGGLAGKRRFLEALTGNIHKFPLQEQQSLSRVYPVQISDEYRNLAGFFGPEEIDDDDDVCVVVGTKAAAPPPQRSVASNAVGNPVANASLEDLRRRLAALQPTGGAAATDLLQRLMEEGLLRALAEAGEKRTKTFFGDLRLNLYKLPEPSQKSLVARFPDLKTDILSLLDSMSQELSKWLDEEKGVGQGRSLNPLVTKLKALFKATLSVPFVATYKHLDAADKAIKETFLLRVALCLRKALERRFTEQKDVSDQVAQLRKQYFYVPNYGELMEEWLNGRMNQCNEEFLQRVSSVLGTNQGAAIQRLRRTFRPGKWLSVVDGKLLDDLYHLFGDKSYPKQVLTGRTLARALKQVSSASKVEYHFYHDVARLPPSGSSYFGQPPQDQIDARVLEVLHRLPPFPVLTKVQPGMYTFGRHQVQFVVLNTGQLVARTPNTDGGHFEVSADNFFVKKGPEEYPDAGKLAVQASATNQHPNGPPCTPLEIPPSSFPPAPSQPMVTATSTGTMDHNQSMHTMAQGPPPWASAGQQRYEPYPGASNPQSMPQFSQPPQPFGMPTMSAPHPSQAQPASVPVFGVEDDEI